MKQNITEEQLIETNVEGKHLIFNLEERSYGLPIGYVNEIIGLMDITPIPQTPEFFKGVINLRGKIIPVLDLRLKLGMPNKDYDSQNCIIIVDVAQGSKNGIVGLVVDMVSEVYNIMNSDVDSSIQYGIDENNNYLTGIGKIKDNVVMLLDIKAVINFSDLSQFVNTADEIDEFINSL